MHVICPRHTLQATSESSSAESAVSDDDGVVISEEDLEESINKAVVRIHTPLFGTINSKLIPYFFITRTEIP